MLVLAILRVLLLASVSASAIHSVAGNLTTADYEWPSQYVQTNQASIRVIVQGAGPAIVILPSYGRDGGDDYNGFAAALVSAGYKVLRPQPRGIFGSTGPMTNVTTDDLVADVVSVIDTLAGGRAIVMGHAYGTSLTKLIALNYPSKVPAIILAAPGSQNISANISNLPLIAGNLSLPVSQRLAALQAGFFAPGHDAHVWLAGWYPATLAMQQAALQLVASSPTPAAGSPTTQVLEIIAAYDPFLPPDQWNTTTDLYPDRVVSVVIPDASHALFPENLPAIVSAVLPFLKQQSTRL
ncbi:alpha/beta-hydrolase [Thozetella sp. PMI_491]|nr:alpha/beta-hydrolase [Thozetella sp. PMI_491]